jgi:quercetin dioxygenase-like cupin family protein
MKRNAHRVVRSIHPAPRSPAIGAAALAVVAILALAAPPSAQAASTPAVATEAAGTYVVARGTREPLAMAAWANRSDRRVSSAAGPKAVARAPRRAVRYEARSVAWPTATVQVLRFTAAGGGVLHPLTDEKTVYVLDGAVQAEVGGQTVTLGAGDVASLPVGALRSAGAAADATVVTWTAASLTPGATPAVVRLASLTPQQAGQLTIRRYEFPGNSVRAVTLAQGLKTTPNSARTDSLIYVTRGPMKFFQDGQEFTVNAGDFIREVAGLMHNWDVTEESGFVTTSALPIGAGPIDPSKATDRPK